MPVDPWGGWNQGFNQLINVLAMKRQEKRDEGTNALAMEKLKMEREKFGMEKEQATRGKQAEMMKDAVVLTQDMAGDGSPEDMAKFQARRSMFVQKWGESPNIPKDYDPQFIQGLKNYGRDPNKDLHSIGSGGLYNATTKETISPVADPTKEREVNIPNWMDTLGVEVLGEEYGTKEGRKKFLGWYNKQMADPKGRAEIHKFQTDYTLRNTPQNITYLQTGEGFVPSITKGPGVGTVGQPTGLGKPLTGEMITTEQQIGTLKETLDRVEKTYKDEYVGPVGGRYGQAKGKWVGLPEDQASFYADNAQVNNTLIYLMSGKQINEQEYERLKTQLPSPELPPSTYKSRMKVFRKTLDSIISEREKNKGGYGKQPRQSAKPTTETSPAKAMPESEARERLKRQGIIGKKADEQIQKYKAAGVVE